MPSSPQDVTDAEMSLELVSRERDLRGRERDREEDIYREREIER